MPRVLIVDDNPEMLRLLADAFPAPEWEATVEPSAKQARDMLTRTTFDLVIVDWVMPEETGLSFAHRVSASGIPVLLVTGNLLAELDASGFPFVKKPFRIDELLSAARKAIATA